MARWTLGVGLLLPGLLVAHPSSAVEGKGPSPAAKRTAAKDTKSPPKRSTAAAVSEPCVHVVRRGQSLKRIAEQHRVTQRSIIAANHLAHPNALRPGQHLLIASCKVAPPPVHAAAKAAPPIAPSDGLYLARVGPGRVPTQLFLAVPLFPGDAPEFQWPVDGPILSAFGRRAGGWHAGLDIGAEMGAPVRAAAPGMVVFSGSEPFYGHMVRLQHSRGFTTVYAHNLENIVEVGHEVAAGTVIAVAGRSGRASACHVHFEIRRDGVAYNPIHLLDPREAAVLASVPTDDDGE